MISVLRALVCMTALVVMGGCGGGGDGQPTAPETPVPPTTYEEGQSAEELEMSLAEPADTTTWRQIILPNGKNLESYIKERGIPVSPSKGSILGKAGMPAVSGPQQRKNDLIATMIAAATNLETGYACGRDNPRCTHWDYEADPNDKQSMGQKGLTYVFNSKTVSVRSADACGERKTFGLDCSGLMYNLAQAAGITIPVGTAATQGKASSWSMPSAWGISMQEVKDGTVEVGDIVVWSGHIGIAKTAGTLSTAKVVSSLGGPSTCEKNLVAGPRTVRAGAIRKDQPTHVLRMVTDISGDYNFGIRCVGANTEAGSVKLKINTTSSGGVEGSGTGTDYDGGPLCFNLTGNYDKPSNVLAGLLSLCDGNRTDSFTVKLLEDSTSYFSLKKEKDNGACAAEARLSRIVAN